MGDLIRTPYSEITATLEVLDRWGVRREDLEKYRKASSWFQEQLAKAFISGKEDFFGGYSEIKPITHAIDCDAPPFVPQGWSVLDADQLPNRVRGIFTWDATRVSLYLSKRQKGDKRIMGNELRKELKNKPTLNANVLDYLLAHPELIPEDWKGRAVFFWGSIYRNSNDYLCVRYLFWGGDRWGWDYGWLGYGFRSVDPVAVRAS